MLTHSWPKWILSWKGQSIDFVFFMGWQASGAVKAMQAFREKLPAFKMKAELLQAVNNNQVFLLTEGSTRFKILDMHRC